LGRGGGGGGAAATNGVFWDMLLCDLVEIWQCFGGTAVSVFMLEDSILCRNVKIKIIHYIYKSDVEINTTSFTVWALLQVFLPHQQQNEDDSSICVVIICKHIVLRETVRMIPRVRYLPFCDVMQQCLVVIY
jgi:hypothetical protein